MKRNRLFISCSLVLALFSACTEQEEPSIPKHGDSGYLKITARANTTDPNWYGFSQGSKMRVFNSSGIAGIPATQQGVYTFNGKSWINNPRNESIGLWPDAILPNVQEQKFFFTAISPETEKTVIALNQSTKTAYEQQDFLVARAIKLQSAIIDPEAYWQNEGIFLHFRHVLSMLKVQVFLPLGNDESYFDEAKNISSVSMKLLKPRDRFKVTYDVSLGESQIAKVSTDETKAGSDLQMYKSGSKADSSVPGNETQLAAMYCFEAILPHGQFFQKEQPCLEIMVNYKGVNKQFTYSPPSNSIMEFKQETKTVVNLILLPKKATDKVLLSSVSMEDWITDKADMDLIPVP